MVRGLFSNTTALRRWPSEAGYMASKVGDYTVNSIQQAFVDVMDDERETKRETFGNVFADIVANEDSIKYLFFPDASQHSDGVGGGNDDQSQVMENVNRMVREDLDLDRLWRGFGSSETHRTFFMSQIIVGRGRPSSSMRPTGSNWHCAPGNNWFVQVAGTKRWFFLDQKHSAYMKPVRGGVNSMWTGSKEMGEMQKYLPLKYVDLQPGDMLYNPDFEWYVRLWVGSTE